MNGQHQTFRARALGVLVALSLVAAGCGSSGSVSAGNAGVSEASTDTGTAVDSSGPNDVPPSLDFLGNLATPRGPRLTTTLDSTAGVVALEAGASVAVEAGAFKSATELTTQVLDFDLTDTLSDDAPWGRAYVVSTVEDVELGAPVTIEIERPASELRAMQLIDGVWSEVAVLGDRDSASIEIPHFSEVVTLVLETWGEEAAARAQAEVALLPPEGADTPANYLRTCLVVVLGVFGGFTNEGVDDFYSPFAFSACTNALIARSSPDGTYVSTACVGDTISGGLDFQEAVDKCAAENGEDTDEVDGDSEQQGETESSAGPEEEQPTIDGGLLDFSLIPGEGGAMKSQRIGLEIDGTSATLSLDLAFSTGVSYSDDVIVCVDNFRWTSVGSSLTVDGARVDGTADLVASFDGPTQCPDTDQPEFGTPFTFAVSGLIGDTDFIGELIVDGLTLPFNASVVGG